MSYEILHSGFDKLRFTITTDIPPDLRVILAEAKAEAVRTNAAVEIVCGGRSFAVRHSGSTGFSVHTGEYGAEWYLLDPENRPPNKPGVTVEFRAFLLAMGGLRDAEAHFRQCMTALGIPYVETQLRVSRVDFAVDILAPWFEPDREALITPPPGLGSREFTGLDETETHCTGSRVTGLRAGAGENRQLLIYDKRAEVIAKRKAGWLTIWNATRAEMGKPPVDLADPNNSRVWRFELRMGNKRLRNRWGMRSWADLDAMIGDAFAEFCDRIRYSIPNADSNRARWPTHELWQAVKEVVSDNLRDMRSGVIPDDVKTANREAHKRMLDGQALGLLVSRAAADGVSEDGVEAFLARQVQLLKERSREHPVPVGERLAKAEARYRFR